MHRLFVAVRPPERIRDQLLDLMQGVPDLRWQGDDQLHLTLRFIGEVERPVAEDIAAELERIHFEKFSLVLKGIGRFDQRRGGALWAGVAPKDQLKALAQKIERACQAAGIPPERRAYHPHITLARLPRSAGPIGDWLARNGRLRAGPWEVTGFTLYESTLSPAGAAYDPLVEYEF